MILSRGEALFDVQRRRWMLLHRFTAGTRRGSFAHIGLFRRNRLMPPEVRNGLVLLREARSQLEERTSVVLGLNTPEAQAAANGRLAERLDSAIGFAERFLEEADPASSADRGEAADFRSAVTLAKMQVGASPEAIQKLAGFDPRSPSA